MAAGLGFKTFTTGEVLTAVDTNGYLMQGVLVFASAAARDAAITSPQEGQFAYLKDTNVTMYYTGSAWANLDTTGMTNPMTTTGDTIYSSSGSTPARLGIGTTGQVLTVASGVPSWATPAGGSTFSGVGVSNSSDLSTSTATWTTITFNTELFDTDAYHSTVTNTSRITIPTGKSGYFLVTIVGLFEGTNATGTRDLAIAKNGTRVLESVTNKATGSNQSCQASIVMSLVATDYIEFQVRQSSGTTVPWYGTGSSGGTSYTVAYLGA